MKLLGPLLNDPQWGGVQVPPLSNAEVAKELGISDVAVGKLCARLQVPKPPRGYWKRWISR